MAKIKKSQNGQEVLEPEVEEIPVSEQLDKAITKEIAKFDPFEARLLELKEKYTGLTITGVEDKSGYEAVRTAIAELRGIRTGTAKDKAIIKKPFLEACSAIEEKSKWIIGEVEKIESPLQTTKDLIDAEMDKIKAERKRKVEERWINRISKLLKTEASVQGEYMTLEDVSFEVVLLKESDDEMFEKMYGQYKTIFDKAEAIRQELQKQKEAEELKQKQEREAFEKQQQEFAEQQRLFKEQQEAAAKKEREIAEAAAKQERELREAEAKKIRDAEQAELKKERDAAEKVRLELEAVRKAEEEKRQAEIKKQQEIEMASDKEKYAETCRYLQSTPIYEMRSGQYRGKMRVIMDFLDGLANN